jgi:hypothetical protein
MPSHFCPNANKTILAEWAKQGAFLPKVESSPAADPMPLSYIDYSDSEPPF